MNIIFSVATLLLARLCHHGVQQVSRAGKKGQILKFDTEVHVGNIKQVYCQTTVTRT